MKERIETLKRMHDCILTCGDEGIWWIWIEGGVPDCPSEDDYEWIASNDSEYREVAELFFRLQERLAEEE